MYDPQYVRQINLPNITQDLLEKLPRTFDAYDTGKKYLVPNYAWSDRDNADIDQWCKANVCGSMYWAFQIITGDMTLHKDNGTKIKLLYLVETGGPSVWTEFFADDQTTLLQRACLEKDRWYAMKVDVYHRVIGVQSGQTRLAITGRLFE